MIEPTVIETYYALINLFTDEYDVDMYVHVVIHHMFNETDPQDIEEDDYLIFQTALILLVRDDIMLDHFGLEGLAVIIAELLDKGEHYYINKEIFNT